MAKGILKSLRKIREGMSQKISDNTDQSDLYSRGLSTEGWNGGYIACLDDVELALNGTQPDRWDKILSKHSVKIGNKEYKDLHCASCGVFIGMGSDPEPPNKWMCGKCYYEE